MKLSNGWKILVVVILTGVAAILLAGDVLYETVLGRNTSESQVLALVETLQIGMSEAEVRRMARLPTFSRLALYEDPDAWVIRAPLTLGAQEWIIVVTFERDHVSGIGVRIGDDFRTKPQRAPQDKGRLILRGEPI